MQPRTSLLKFEGGGFSAPVISQARFLEVGLLLEVKTNQELFDAMFDLVFAVPGDDEALRMKSTTVGIKE